MPVPRAVIMARISSLSSTLSTRVLPALRILPRRGNTACVRRSRPCLAGPPAESPSTRNSSHFFGSRSVQSASLPGKELDSSALGRQRLLDDLAGDRRVLLQVLRQLLVDNGVDDALHLVVAELDFGLRLELRMRQLDRDNGGETFADIVAAEVVFLLLKNAVLARVVVEHA